MLVTELVPRTLAATEVAAGEGWEWLAAVYACPEPRYVRLNMITSLTGSAAGEDGTSETLTNAVDRAILGAIRGHSDVVLVGAQTVRAEGYVVPRSARLAIVTTTGDLRGHRLAGGDGRLLIVCPAARAADIARSAAAVGADIVAVEGRIDALDPRAVVDALADRGLSRVVCEGGPSLASQFAAAGVIDEYCITVAPALEPASAPFLAVDPASRPRTGLAGMLVDDAGFSYLRLRARQPAPAP